jgi:hypothetical protein
MTATEHAPALRGPLRSALADLGSVNSSEASFDPFTQKRSFHVAIGDNATTLIGLPLVELLGRSSGLGLQIAMSMTDRAPIASHLEEGQIDLLIDAQCVVLGNAKMRMLLRRPFKMAQRKGNSRGTSTLDLDTYLSPRHVVASPLCGPVHGYMDEHLEQLGYRRNVVLPVLQFRMVPDILGIRLCVDAASRLAGRLLRPGRHVRPAVCVPLFVQAMAWHPRNHAEPGLV